MDHRAPSALRPLLLVLLLSADRAEATAGFAEYAWSFHDRPGQWIEWHHGDICPPDAPGKDCVFIVRTGARPSPALPGPEAPRDLYLNTIRALLPLVVVWLGLDRLWRRWRRRETDPRGWTVRSTWGWGLTTLVALAWAPEALRVLFPASPSADGWDTVIGLSFNIAIALAPFTLWWTYRTLFPPASRVPAKGWARAFLWPALLLSSLLAPLLLWGPPNLLLFLFPPTMLPNIVVSLLGVWAASKATDAMAGGTDTTR